ncbi:hypothetical protein SBRY_130008 [Actinacidiphila bryophytorum]|uniref:Uncharacterized protein n=1 Tax=Actinacidiphila bryophytorum TaxID=1436133 RepID=A0A9W4EDA9_9ACTN|nr:hypothetical protein SBRY_130008 [Actinacidiphila bryophytorum]
MDAPAADRDEGVDRPRDLARGQGRGHRDAAAAGDGAGRRRHGVHGDPLARRPGCPGRQPPGLDEDLVRACEVEQLEAGENGEDDAAAGHGSIVGARRDGGKDSLMTIPAIPTRHDRRGTVGAWHRESDPTLRTDTCSPPGDMHTTCSWHR